MDELSEDRRFQPVLDDPAISDHAGVTRVVLLSGKLYYDLVKERQKRQLDDKVAFIRVEELSPFPFRAALNVMARYANASDILWLQEEPRNQGAWTHVEPRLNAVTERLASGRGRECLRVRYRGRKEDAVPAPGIASLYAAQQKAVIDAAFDGL